MPGIQALPADLPYRFQLTYLHLIFAGYAAFLAGFILWRVGRRPGAGELALLLGLMSLALSLSVVPEEYASLGHKLAFSGVWAALVLQVLYFWTRFPHPMDPQAVNAMSRHAGSGMWYDGLNRASAALVHWVLGHRVGWAALVLVSVAYGWVLGFPEVSPYNFLGHRMDTGLVYLAYAGPIGFFHSALTAAVAWTAFRLSGQRGRRQVLWIMLAHLLTGFWILMVLILNPLAAMTGSGVLAAFRDGLMTTLQPVGWALTLTGYAVALFFAGAFDLRPIITRSTVYGMSLLSLTFIFACVEEVMEAQVATRMELPEGVGTWVGAAAIAVLMGPVRDRMAKALQQWVPDLNLQGDEGTQVP